MVEVDAGIDHCHRDPGAGIAVRVAATIVVGAGADGAQAVGGAAAHGQVLRVRIIGRDGLAAAARTDPRPAAYSASAAAGQAAIARSQAGGHR